MIYIFWASSSQEEAEKIATDLLTQHLIACACFFPSVTSLYRWNGSLEKNQECKVLFKTQKKHFSSILTYIQHHGSYQIPEVVQIAVEQVNPDYLTWLIQETNFNQGIL